MATILFDVVGCDILRVRLEETELSSSGEREEDLPSLLSAKMSVTEDITATRQTCLVGTALGLCLVDIRQPPPLTLVQLQPGALIGPDLHDNSSWRQLQNFAIKNQRVFASHPWFFMA